MISDISETFFYFYFQKNGLFSVKIFTITKLEIFKCQNKLNINLDQKIIFKTFNCRCKKDKNE